MIGGDEVLANDAVRKTPSMNSDSKIREVDNLGSTRTEDVNALNVRQPFADLAFRVVISFDDEDSNACFNEANHLLSEEECGTEITQLSVIDITGEEDEVNVLTQGKVYQTHKRPASCSSE
jgi:hypothetical protein